MKERLRTHRTCLPTRVILKRTIGSTICLAAALVVAMLAGNANASEITWETAVPIDNAGAFVNTSGSLVAAINSDTAGDNASINGVNFQGTNQAGWNAGVTGAGGITISSNATEGNFGSTFVQGGGPPPTITNSAISNLIGSGIWNPQTVTLTGLRPGDTYVIQIIGNDSRNGRHEGYVTLLSDGVNDVATSLTNGTAGQNPLSNSATTAANPRLPGNAIVGTFIADGTTQSFDLQGTLDGGASFSGGRAQINGFQLRTIPAPTPSGLVHPGISHTRSDLERMKLMIEADVEPWASTFQALSTHPRAQHTIPINVLTDHDLAFRTEFNSSSDNYLINDSTTAYLNALMWYFTGDARHAEKSIEVFNTWKVLRRNTEIPLVSGRVNRLIEAAEIIKHTYDGWDPVEMQEFADMLVYPGYSNTTVPQAAIDSRDVSFYWRCYNGDPQRIGNQGLSAARLVMAMGIFLDNEIMYDRAVRMLRGQPHRADDVPYQSGPAINGAQIPTCEFYEQHELLGFESTIPDFGFNEVIGHYIHENGQSQEADRDQAHPLGGIATIMLMSDIAWNQGDDLFSELDNRALLGLEFHTRYNLSFDLSFPDQPAPWEPTVESGEFFQRFVRNGRRFALKVNPGINCDQVTVSRGGTNLQPVYELPLSHYRDRLGLPVDDYKWTQRGRDYYVSQLGIVEGITDTIQYPQYGSLFYPRVSPGDPISGFSSDGLPVFTMHMIPNTIEAENFDYFPIDGEGRTYSDSTIGNTGFAYRVDSDVDVEESAQGDIYVGQTADGEFLTYTVSVPEDGNYDIQARVSAANGVSSIMFSFDGVDVTGAVAVPQTGSSESWSIITVAQNVVLSRGVHQLRIDTLGALSLDYFVIDESVSPLDISFAVQGSNTAPTVSNSDLAQTEYLSSSAVSSEQISTRHQELFNGQIGDENSSTTVPGLVRLNSGDSLTINFDTSVNIDGYDITQIDSVFGWSTLNGGRSNQGYSIRFNLVGGASFVEPAQHWAPNDPAFFWTKVSFTDANGGTIISGVESITFDFTETANASGLLIAREIDIFGVPINTFLHGDVNRDGFVSFLDISPFIDVLSSGVFQAEADCNQDGVVNFFDISPFIQALTNS